MKSLNQYSAVQYLKLHKSTLSLTDPGSDLGNITKKQLVNSGTCYRAVYRSLFNRKYKYSGEEKKSQARRSFLMLTSDCFSDRGMKSLRSYLLERTVT